MSMPTSFMQKRKGPAMNRLLGVMLITEAVIAIGFMVNPGAVLTPFGLVLDDTSTTAFRILGSALSSFPVLLWFSRKSSSVELKKVAVRSVLVYFFLSTVFFVVAQMAGQMNSRGWILIALHLGFLVWGAYVLAGKGSTA